MTSTATKPGEFSVREFLSQDPDKHQDAWYDYFCDDSLLPSKTTALVECLRSISTSLDIDVYNTYVFFKNNQPLDGDRFDDFRICDLVTGDVIYTITPVWGHNGALYGKSVVYGRENKFEAPLVSGSWSDVMDYFGCGACGYIAFEVLCEDEDEEEVGRGG